MLIFFFIFFSSFFSYIFIYFFSSFFLLFFRVRKKKQVFLRTPNLPNQGWARSFFWTPTKPRFGPDLSPNSEPARVWSSEKGTGLSPNLRNQGWARFFLPTPNLTGFRVRKKELAFLQTPNLPNQGYIRSFSKLRTCRTRVIPVLSPNSELKLQTPVKNTILDHLAQMLEGPLTVVMGITVYRCL